MSNIREIPFTADPLPSPASIAPESSTFTLPEIQAANAASPETETETAAAKIARLEAALAAARRLGENQKVESDAGPMTVKEFIADFDKFLEETALSTLASQREYASYQTSKPTVIASDERPIVTRDEAIKLMGLKTFADLSPSQKADMQDVRPTDLAKVDLTKYFGKGSDSYLANELAIKSPGRYRIYKMAAIKARII